MRIILLLQNIQKTVVHFINNEINRMQQATVLYLANLIFTIIFPVMIERCFIIYAICKISLSGFISYPSTKKKTTIVKGKKENMLHFSLKNNHLTFSSVLRLTLSSNQENIKQLILFSIKKEKVIERRGNCLQFINKHFICHVTCMRKIICCHIY